MKKKIRKICITGILTALYCVLSALMKFTLIGNIQIDLGYIALGVACLLVGSWAGFVGAVGCGLESILFSAYGFSPSWFVANLIIGTGCGLLFQKLKMNTACKCLTIIGFVAVGVLCVKTGIECWLYQIPLFIKLPKNAVAFIVDSITMILGTLVFYPRLPKKYKDKI